MTKIKVLMLLVIQFFLTNLQMTKMRLIDMIEGLDDIGAKAMTMLKALSVVWKRILTKRGNKRLEPIFSDYNFYSYLFIGATFKGISSIFFILAEFLQHLNA